MDEIQCGEFQDDLLSLLDRDFIGRVDKFSCLDLDDTGLGLSLDLGRLRAERCAAQQRADAGQRAQQQGSSGLHHERTVVTGNSLMIYPVALDSASTSRKPSPLIGAAAFQGRGSRFSCEPGSGKGNISDLAA